MKICDDCMKKDVCKFKEEVEAKQYDNIRLAEPLLAEIKCSRKLFMPTVQCPSVSGASSTFDEPDYWTYTGYWNPEVQAFTYSLS